jgi:hypothetical protein
MRVPCCRIFSLLCCCLTNGYKGAAVETIFLPFSAKVPIVGAAASNASRMHGFFGWLDGWMDGCMVWHVVLWGFVTDDAVNELEEEEEEEEKEESKEQSMGDGKLCRFDILHWSTTF